jgi:hypothetical protein
VTDMQVECFDPAIEGKHQVGAAHVRSLFGALDTWQMVQHSANEGLQLLFRVRLAYSIADRQ